MKSRIQNMLKYRYLNNIPFTVWDIWKAVQRRVNKSATIAEVRAIMGEIWYADRPEYFNQTTMPRTKTQLINNGNAIVARVYHRTDTPATNHSASVESKRNSSGVCYARPDRQGRVNLPEAIVAKATCDGDFDDACIKLETTKIGWKKINRDGRLRITVTNDPNNEHGYKKVYSVRFGGRGQIFVKKVSEIQAV